MLAIHRALGVADGAIWVAGVRAEDAIRWARVHACDALWRLRERIALHIAAGEERPS